MDSLLLHAAVLDLQRDALPHMHTVDPTCSRLYSLLCLQFCQRLLLWHVQEVIHTPDLNRHSSAARHSTARHNTAQHAEVSSVVVSLSTDP